MKFLKLTLAISIVIVAAGFWYRHQYPPPPPPSQLQLARCVAFFGTQPSLSRTAAFLKSQGISYDQEAKADIFDGNQATDFQRQHRREIDSEIVFRIYNLKYPLCGQLDAIFIVSFDKKGRLLKAENIESRHGCLDF